MAEGAAAILRLWGSRLCAASGPSCPERTTRDTVELSSRLHHGSPPPPAMEKMKPPT